MFVKTSLFQSCNFFQSIHLFSLLIFLTTFKLLNTQKTHDCLSPVYQLGQNHSINIYCMVLYITKLYIVYCTKINNQICSLQSTEEVVFFKVLLFQCTKKSRLQNRTSFLSSLTVNPLFLTLTHCIKFCKSYSIKLVHKTTRPTHSWFFCKIIRIVLKRVEYHNMRVFN